MSYTFQDLQKWRQLHDEVVRETRKNNFVRRERMRLTTAIAWLQFISAASGWEVCKNIFLCRCYELKRPITGSSEYDRIIIRFGKKGGYKEVAMYVGKQFVCELPSHLLNRVGELSPRALKDVMESVK